MLINYIRTFILYLIVVIAMRLMGKKQIGQLQPSEFVIALMLSELASIPMQDTAIPLLYGIIPILILMSIEIAVSIISLKSKKARSFLEGDAVIIIKHSVMQIEEMRRMRYNLNDVMEELRKTGITDIREVEYGILETNGTLSIIPKGKNRPLCAEDVKLEVPEEPFYFTVISDGEYDTQGMENAKMKKEEVIKKLKKDGIKSEKEVFFAAADEKGDIYAQLYNGEKIL
ncbi:MAG: DUF421 domain-containing protein [Bacillota bacterium]|nr:DUF421 domain-containing protein [Bacillota bacterium]